MHTVYEAQDGGIGAEEERGRPTRSIRELQLEASRIADEADDAMNEMKKRHERSRSAGRRTGGEGHD